ncbi:hypothetical protein ACOJUR_02470 [Alicyclobacillus tolerans]|uniref:hypothetical protein n=1 Tax=Alicyclobacillus tolerans TaxID=90970 RepID=UPI003B7C47C8
MIDPNIRYTRAALSSIDTVQLHLRKPWMCAFWSFAFPGLGHLARNRNLTGYFFIMWELIVNTQSHINLAIFETLIGHFNDATNVLNTRWLLLYVGTYIYCIWDSYQGAVNLNKLYMLAIHRPKALQPMKMNALEINYLDKKLPWIAPVWSAFMPGAGHFYLHKIPNGILFLVWWIVVAYKSNLLTAIQLAFTGHFSASAAALDIQWYLFMPSIYSFSLYDSYLTAVEQNRLYELEQARFLKEHYQRISFSISRLFVK